MRYHTKEYHTLWMAVGAAELYEPVIDKKYSDEEIENLYQQAMDDYIEEERTEHDMPPELIIEEGEELEPDFLQELVDEFENRGPFDEEEARAEFEEMYRDNLEEPDEDLPDWVKESVDPRILAMYLMPEKTYRKLVEEDEKNEAKFDELDEKADEALENIYEELPERYQLLTEELMDLEDSDVTDVRLHDGRLDISMCGWDDEGDDVDMTLSFIDAELVENEDVSATAWEDEDGDLETDCELLYCELYLSDDKPEVHMLFDNNGLKYLTVRCSDVQIRQGAGE